MQAHDRSRQFPHGWATCPQHETQARLPVPTSGACQTCPGLRRHPHPDSLTGYQIFIDTLELAVGMSSWYQPQEKVQWWYERGARSGSMISGGRSSVENYDMTNPRPSDGKYYVSTSYIYANGSWVTNSNDSPSLMRTGTLGGITNHLGLAVTSEHRRGVCSWRLWQREI